MKVKMITCAKGPGVNWQPGQEVEVSDVEGKQLVDGRFAISLEPPKPEPVEVKPEPKKKETAAIKKDVETADVK